MSHVVMVFNQQVFAEHPGLPGLLGAGSNHLGAEQGTVLWLEVIHHDSGRRWDLWLVPSPKGGTR